ncbi:MAG: hypothetical protein IPL61_34810 [Myxococcales bacterium]|nr:hypothetical protein [Myxococcales bacterium]
MLDDIFGVSLVVAIFLAVIGIPVWLRLRALRRLALMLGGTAGWSSVRATVDGVAVRLAYASRGSGKSRERWTYVDVPLPPGEPLTLNIIRHGLFERGRIARGALLDLRTGDDEFDRIYRVEAAPADVVLRVLDPEVRAYLRERADAELYTTDGALCLAVRGTLTDARAHHAIRLAVQVLASVRAAHAALDRAAPTSLVGAPHRGVPSDGPARGARAARAEEAARLDRDLHRRDRRWRTISVAITIAAGVAIAVAKLLG